MTLPSYGFRTLAPDAANQCLVFTDGARAACSVTEKKFVGENSGPQCQPPTGHQRHLGLLTLATRPGV